MTSNQTIPIKKNNELICSNILKGQINSSSILTVSAYCLMILTDFNNLLFLKWYAAPFPNSHKSSHMTDHLFQNSMYIFVMNIKCDNSEISMSITVQQDATTYSLLHFLKPLYMFRVVTPPKTCRAVYRNIINCI
jgi:hypothetical protein